MLGDHRHHNLGGANIDCAAQLWQAGKACRWWFVDWTESCCLDEELLGRPSAQREYLRLRYRLRSPRPQHGEADLQEQEAWKKVGATDSQSPSGASRGRRRSLD